MEKEFKIRKGKFEDMKAVMRAHSSSIKEVCISDYSQDQVEKWGSVSYDIDLWRKSVEQDYFEVVEIDGVVEGFCHSCIDQEDKAHLMGLYLTSKAIGHGIGKVLVGNSKSFFKNNNKEMVNLTATITAKEFYIQQGFKTVEEIKVKVRGAEIECFKMELSL